METNNLQTVLKETGVGQFMSFDWLTGMNLLGVFFVLVLLVGYLLRRIEKIDNRFMWVLIPVATALYSYLATKPGSDGRAYTVNGVHGAISATIAVLVVVVLHDKILAFAAKRWPILSFLVADEPVNQQQKENNENHP